MYATGDALRVVKEVDMGNGRAVYVRFNEEYLRTTGVDRAARVAAAIGLNIPYTTASAFRTEVLKLFQQIADTNITDGETTLCPDWSAQTRPTGTYDKDKSKGTDDVPVPELQGAKDISTYDPVSMLKDTGYQSGNYGYTYI